jgi:iron complex transport system ATP-binding protein
MTTSATVEELRIVRDDRVILSVDELAIRPGERWALLGPNGSGKSTLLSVLSGRLWPTAGRVTLLGKQVGHVDLRVLRARLGLLSATLTRQLRPSLAVHEVVVTGIDGALEPWWRSYGDLERARALELLELLGVGSLADKALGVISEGERAKVLLARVLIAEPELLLLDEPAAGLDLGSREELLRTLAALFGPANAAPVVLVTHHLEELPAGISHALLLRAGRPVAMGPAAEVLTGEHVSAAFGIDVAVEHHVDGRFSARAFL